MTNNMAPVGADMVSFEPSRSREDIANLNGGGWRAWGPEKT